MTEKEQFEAFLTVDEMVNLFQVDRVDPGYLYEAMQGLSRLSFYEGDIFDAFFCWYAYCEDTYPDLLQYCNRWFIAFNRDLCTDEFIEFIADYGFPFNSSAIRKHKSTV